MQQNDTFVLITGCAGFIGFHVAKKLLAEGVKVVGLDNLNEYYDTKLKEDRLNILKTQSNFHFIKGSIENDELLESIFTQFKFDSVIHLAAQAGVRYSLKNPEVYIQSNLVGFANILECCRTFQIKHLIYASTSSVYGKNKQIPFSCEDRTDHPISLYAATKKANELMAHAYTHLYQLPTTGLRFFTVYGPWGRPDMALFTFAESITKGEPINLFNHGRMKRDFTYIDDVVESIWRILKTPHQPESPNLYRIYNIGNRHPIQLDYFVQLIEEKLGMKAQKNYVAIQPGDVLETYADIDELVKDFGYAPMTSIEDGITRFVEWFKEYY
ncbi:NAD-dependent epimerase [Falsibacillus albus]|uniref:NAD-dependent epimerase n=1 Tax=Falsibacillus albus TaxID=2478915 RepID=A0A3L7JS59_9BACI|nr:NAD-dependent epimerase [Falsibacillus albus]RLQ93105.1 NAD-dependent epimerase [Falsibacillus albus]